MKSVNRWIAVTALLASAGTVASAATPDGLVVRLSAPTPVLRGDVDVVVDVAVTNTTPAPITVLRWDLPTAQSEGRRFQITRDGEPVAYTGRIVKRRAPTADDYLRIDAGATLHYPVELTATYDLSRNGTYAIAYTGTAGDAVSAADALRSPTMYLWLESRTVGKMTAAMSTVDASGGASTSSVVFTGNCSASRQTALQQALDAASVYAGQAVTYFNTTRAATQRFARWFGANPDRVRFNNAKAHYAAIQDAYATKPITLDCSCTESYYAYVYANQPYKIYLCNAFWTAPLTGTDSKAGTLIHETSHFTVVAGTQDYAYGQTAAAALAISNPNQAVFNADSHEYFAENTPTLP